MLILLDINQLVNHNYFIHPHFCFDDVVVSVSSALSPVSLFVGMVDHTYFTHRKIKTTTFFSGLSAVGPARGKGIGITIPNYLSHYLLLKFSTKTQQLYVLA